MCPEQSLPGALLIVIRSPTWNRQMTSTLYQSAAIDRIIAPWAGKIAELFATIVETILMIAQKFLQHLAGSRRRLPEHRALAHGAVLRAISPHDVEAWLCAAFGERAPRPCAPPIARIRAVRLPYREMPEQRILKGYERVLQVRACMPPRKELVRLCAGL